MSTVSTCNICGKRDKPVWKSPSKMERLILLIVAYAQGWISQGHAKANIRLPEFHYCHEHGLEAGQKLKKLVDYRYKKVDPIGVRLIEMLAGELVEHQIKSRSMEGIVKEFLINFLKDESEDGMDIYCEEYGEYQLEKRDGVHTCLECGQEVSTENVRFIIRSHQKEAFAIFAGPAVSGTMNCEQAAACLLLSSIPICPAHREDHAVYLKKLETSLLDENHAKLYNETIQKTFGWRTPGKRVTWKFTLNIVALYVNSIDVPEFNCYQFCDYCRTIKENCPVYVDGSTKAKAHWDCFVKKAQEIQSSLKEPAEMNGTVELQIPDVSVLEEWEGKDMLKLLHAWGETIGHRDEDYLKDSNGKRKGLNFAKERARVLIFLSKYHVDDRNPNDHHNHARHDEFENQRGRTPKTPKTPGPSANKPESALKKYLAGLGLSLDFYNRD